MSRPARDVTLVFGGSGFLGRFVVRAALRHARETAREKKRRAGLVVSASRNPERALDGSEDSILTAAFDVATKGEAERMLSDLAPSRVILLTAMTRVEDCDSFPGYARALNVDFPARVARACAAEGVRLVHVSTDLVFGAESPRASGFREDDPVAPTSKYGATKAEGERAVLAAHPTALIARLPLCWDEHGTGCGTTEPLVRALRRGERPKLFTDEWRTPLHVGAAAEALVRAAHGDASGTLHFGGSERITRFDLGLSVAIASGLEPEFVRGRLRATTREEAGVAKTRPGDVCLDSNRARELGLALPGVASSLGEITRRTQAAARAAHGSRSAASSAGAKKRGGPDRSDAGGDGTAPPDPDGWGGPA